MRILMTGAAGFIGFHLARALLAVGHTVAGLDNMNPYYDVRLKRDRLSLLWPEKNFSFHELDLADGPGLHRLFAEQSFTHVVNLAAQAGVRYSLTNPEAYIQSNLVGFGHVLEACRHHKIRHLIFASSSSVYGLNTKMPFCETDPVDHPVSLYAATKKSNEMMAHAYSHLYGLPVTGLRFFTVYGPWGRPDMAPMLFTKAILEGRPIDVFNEGRMQRDFTYIDDIIEGVLRVIERPPTPNPAWNSEQPDPASSRAAFALYNMGHNQPISLEEFITALEGALGLKARRNLLPMQPGDVPATCADIEALRAFAGFAPVTSLATGLKAFVQWYKAYYGEQR
jgi:UDP-glucuronate 4-epimerase